MSEPDVTPSGGKNPVAVLTRKVGPFYGWVWVALAIGGYVVYRYVKSRSTPPSNVGADTANVTGTGTTASDGSSVDGGLGSGTVDTGFTQTGNSTVIPTGPRDNGTWARMAVAYLVSTGVPPTQASNAIANYLGHKPLTTDQRTLVNKAIRSVGSPPEGIVASTVISQKPTHHNIAYTTKRGDTLHGLAERFYGNQGLWLHIRSFNANLKTYSPDEHIKAGLHITIPFFVEQPKAG